MNVLTYSDEIRRALIENKPIVALESTIISHGMPYPENIKMALEVEQIIKDEGAVPATIAIMDGQIKIGLTKDEIERLGTEDDVVKTSVRDLPGVLAKELTGATTVATTAYAAHQAGIRFFATGGLGGVHRDVAEHLDISADLVQLAKSNICIVSAGVKSILDIPKTLEFLETLGVPVYGYETDRYPGFYFRETDQVVESITRDELAALMKVKDHLNMKQAVHVAVPVPNQDAMDREFIQGIIDKALIQANKKDIKGKDITPFLLSHIKDQTEGESLKTNISLMKNNAKVAAQFAVRYKQ
ncbi:pseudouridine-5'-phosphate glycosidase [Aquibacillus sp. 3ASR75-11]|uniref:Pseudouridine-5'-phosphate glycosidase n=1 Tax=Terrihalobacillus insolitus TaxID=2950438 RepID=A0A9X4AP76_9BACI|nr:pseudouridine-5'-phosphate glycosidase [Terrihalobacillus insolitus]MDC3413449.1 pseudouridine-5'-phosphate glycosidase [Terrihalobacillus insolitus]MDC3425260.1 pseudouridine-5'-phosphate glycosidase [Terrihalobacillus insolitus]